MITNYLNIVSNFKWQRTLWWELEDQEERKLMNGKHVKISERVCWLSGWSIEMITERWNGRVCKPVKRHRMLNGNLLMIPVRTLPAFNWTTMLSFAKRRSHDNALVDRATTCVTEASHQGHGHTVTSIPNNRVLYLHLIPAFLSSLIHSNEWCTGIKKESIRNQK